MMRSAGFTSCPTKRNLRSIECSSYEEALEWIEEHDPVGHLQMPGARVVTLRPGTAIVARAVAQSMEIPYGMGIEEKVKDLFTRMEVR